MQGAEIRKVVELEDRNWWYRERRTILARELDRIGRPGFALDIGAAGGGNTRVLRARGWRSVALEYGAEGAAVARDRGLDVIRGDARFLPLPAASVDLVIALDVLEHIDDDARAAAEIHRVLRPGGTLFATVPCDMRLWSPHDVALGHVRRYTRETLSAVISGAGLHIDNLWSWNVLLRPVVAVRRRRMSQSGGSELEELPRLVNASLKAIVTVERYLPVRSLPGVSLMVRAIRRPDPQDQPDGYWRGSPGSLGSSPS
jgi:SAM-dependent methyltransferase